MTRRGLLATLAMCLGARTAAAFGGFYVGAGDAPLVNQATHVVLVRDGTRTVLALQPQYEGPAEPFALIVPVPATVQQRDISVLAPDALADVDRASAPRLVEYWEQDPCAPPAAAAPAPSRPGHGDDGIKIDAALAGEYQIAVLAVKDAAALDSWLRRDKLALPAGAEPLLRPYLERGMKLVVAKVDPAKVRFADGRAVLSPLRVQYDSEKLTLPIRLGLANSAGTQDLVVHVLAPDQRYEVANHRNVTVATNLIVKPDVRAELSAFYTSLLEATLARHGDAAVTEFAGDAVGALGDDRRLVLTRLHVRYGKATGEDLELQPAPPIAGGRERIIATGRLEDGAQLAATNAFEARYVVRHPWRGPLTCTNPVRGRWSTDAGSTRFALDLAFSPRATLDVATTLTHDVPELALSVGEGTRPLPAVPPSTVLADGPRTVRGGCRATTGDASGAFALVVLLLLPLRRRR